MLAQLAGCWPPRPPLSSLLAGQALSHRSLGQRRRSAANNGFNAVSCSRVLKEARVVREMTPDLLMDRIVPPTDLASRSRQVPSDTPVAAPRRNRLSVSQATMRGWSMK